MLNKELEDYFLQFPSQVQTKLFALRELVLKVAPMAQEKLSYGMPTYHFIENLVHFAAYKTHIGFYPTPSAIVAFEKDIASYKHAKGSVQFPLNEELPMQLIEKMVQFRLNEVNKLGK